MDATHLILTNDIIHLILQEICLEAREDLRSIALVSKQFYRLAIPILYRSLVVTAAKLHLLDFAKAGGRWRNFQTNVITCTHDITVQDVGSNWEILAELLLRLNILHSIKWNSWKVPFPALIRKCLAKHWPNAALCLESFPVGQRSYDILVDHDLELRERASLCQNIQSIKADINYNQDLACRNFKELLMSCPKLQVLHLLYNKKASQETRQFSFNLGVRPNDKIAPLRELRYEILRESPYSQTPLIPSTFCDWSQLRSLELRGNPMILFMKSIQGHIPLLEVLKLGHMRGGPGGWHGQEANQIINDFISSTQSLVQLDVVDTLLHLLPSTISSQSRLRRLSYCKPSPFEGPDVECYIPNILPFEEPGGSYRFSSIRLFRADDVKELAASCLRLSSLTIHMQEFTNDLPYDFLWALTRFPELEFLYLYVPFYLARDSRYPEYHVHLEADTATIRYLSTYLFKNKIGTPFRKIEVCIGDMPKHFPSDPGPCTRLTCGGGRCYHRPKPTDRPTLLFTSCMNSKGDITFEDDSSAISQEAWKHYLDREKICPTPGLTYPKNIEAWNRLGDEADQIMGMTETDIKRGIEDDASDMSTLSSLFGGSDSEPEIIEE